MFLDKFKQSFEGRIFIKLNVLILDEIIFFMIMILFYLPKMYLEILLGTSNSMFESVYPIPVLDLI